MRPLLAMLDRNEQRISAVHHFLLDTNQGRREITPAAEWLLDNIHIVVDQIREIRQDLPRGYYSELPKLKGGAFAGQPRTYAIALELIEHTDGRIDLEHLLRFITAYQSVAALTMGELWAVAIMLRLGLVENLARLVGLILAASTAREQADQWADRLLAEEAGADMRYSPAFAELALRHVTLPSAFAVRLLYRLRAYDGEHDIGPIISWLEQQPVIPFSDIEALIHAENQRQASSHAAIGNTITSMRTLSTIDWADWFERVSQVEQVLRQDPAAAYARGTFATRDHYRHAVEQLARRSGTNELEVALRVVELARKAAPAGEARQAHVGYYLIDAGRAALEAELGYHPTPLQAAQRVILKHPTAFYLGSLAVATAAAAVVGRKLTGAAPIRALRHQDSHGLAAWPLDGRQRLGMPAALLLLPASALAKELVDRGVARMLAPRRLPRLDLRDGIPPELRTIVVIPTLLLTPASVRGQVAALEVLALANSDPHLHFALLSDFADAPAAEMPQDAELLTIARAGIEQLNAQAGSDRFFLLHRKRTWNERQRCFMGWERKRGKLEEFNHLLAGSDATTFVACIGDLEVLPQIRYVITLDSDTQLPRDAGRALIGSLAHPLNQAVIDPQTRRVTAGYGILQPRVGIDLPSAMRSRFARIFSGNVGIDPYTTAVSDVYMDQFGEGIYAGKGIYDPAALRETLAGRFPDNALLSHDLIEGCYARAGLLSDVELLDSYPAAYASFAARQHRWVRGDWQIAAWALPWTPSAHGPARNVLPPIARFKIFDNLRRSLVPPATIALLAAGWLGGYGRRRAAMTTAYALLPLALPGLLDFARSLLGGRPPQSTLADLAASAARCGLNITFLPDQALSNLDAIARTLVRLLITRRDLLEWETAAEAHSRLTRSSGGLLRRMAPVAALGALAAVPGAQRLARSWPAALPVVADWLAAPAIAAWLDQPAIKPARPLEEADRRLLRQLARSTWAFFEQFVTAEANYLAPDNFQESPSPLVAYRTSPTNIGLQLLADLAAYDFGYIGLLELTVRTERVLATLARLECYRGHLLNWYDTQTLDPLPPAYVSTVDSGNLAGHLLTLRQGYLALRDRPIIGPQALAGLQDTLALFADHVPADDAATQRQIAALAERLSATPATLGGYRQLLHDFAQHAGAIRTSGDAAVWLARLEAQARSLRADLPALPPAELEAQAPPTWAELAAMRGGRPIAEDAGSFSFEESVNAQGAEASLGGLSPSSLLARHDMIAATALAQAGAMDFTFLYDDRRRIFAIGHSVAEQRRDNSFYDLLASEARLASFVAIAKGDVPQEHWFHIGRTLLDSGAGTVLASWSGTMFEYLMPLLVMRNYPGTLLDATYQTAVERQIRYGRQQHVPWGVSESAYNVRDPSMNYQYRAFGVPGLGLRRGLGSDLVIAPYASVLALLVEPAAALANLKALIAAGMHGRYGLYEAIDYTAARLPPGASYAIVRSFMAHHQGMSLLAFANTLHGNSMQRRFHAEPQVQATETLLQEQIAHGVALYRPDEAAAARVATVAAAPSLRQVTTPTTAVPYTHLLSNGTYSVMVTNAGGGYSTSGELAVTRWRSDVARDGWGSFCYIRDVRSDLVWSAAYQPTRHATHEYRVIFGLEKVEFRQQVAGIETRMEIAVSPEDNLEVRRITIVNLTAAQRELELTSYAEIVLAPAAADAAHPAFSNLFVETEFVAEHDALLASRRPRSAAMARPWALHVLAVRGHATSDTDYETDRAAFVGRGRTSADPLALHGPLGQHTGAVLDPIFSLRRRVRIVPGGTAQITFATAMADSREQALHLAAKYRDPDAAARVFAMAWTQAQVELRHLNIGAEDAQRFQRLAAAALYLDGLKRAKPELLERNVKGQPGLWAYGISGDEPIIVVQVESGADLSLVQELLQAHQYWRLKRLTVDLVILNEQAGGYLQEVQDQILGLVRSGGSSAWLNQRGGIFVLRADMLPEDDRVLLQTVARALLSTRRGNLGQHLRRRSPEAAALAPPRRGNDAVDSVALPAADLRQRTPYGGFDAKGEFVIDLGPGQATPAPWSNVVANERFGFVISERGGGYTWSENSRENRLTPWSNDPVGDPPGEVLYLRDEASGALWSAATQPAGGGPMRVQHGFGYSAFTQQRYGLTSELRLSVAPDASVKIFRLRLKHHGAEPRRLGLTLYVEWVLGVFREAMAPYVVTSFDAPTAGLLARNAYNPEFGARIAFIAASERSVTVCGDRVEFIGRNGDLHQPAALQAGSLSGRVGAGFDPCGALCCTIELAAGEEREIVFLLGQGADLEQARDLIARYRDPAEAAAAERQSRERWQALLGQVRVATPQPELDLLLNGWLLYQTLACRIWARSAFYQSGGAYGFRDQLQDVMALVHTDPAIVREQILRAAARQFVAGDVQHWWHPPTGRGIRTKFSDDYLWLPFVVDHYCTATGDTAILDERIAFLEGRALEPAEAEYYDLPAISPERGSLYEHCTRAVDLALGRMGPHGLPLMGAGDWNDGMNMVGHAGRGESVWVGWFLHVNLERMAEIAAARGDDWRAERYTAEAARLRDALEQHAWDGAWYLRAFYDDGTPLGTAQADECRIDSLTQSWAVIAGANDPARARQALAAADEQLIDRQAGLIKLFAPPFDHTPHDPGYIKGYLPGVRENGGQYTHAAIWMIWAYALLGDGAQAGALLDLINPIRHARSNPDGYKVEPYTIAADVYTVSPHSGRGGWTWYTGSAGWYYRLGIEMILGLRRAGNILTIVPCISPEWPGYAIWYRYGAARYHIQVTNPQRAATGVSSVVVDGTPVVGGRIELCDDGAEHSVQVTLSSSPL